MPNEWLDRASWREVNAKADAAVNGRLSNSAELDCSDYRLTPTDAADRVRFPARSNDQALPQGGAKKGNDEH